MGFNFTKITLRQLIRNKVYTSINIAGLTIGIACVFMIMLWVNDELKFDCFNKNADIIYRVIAEKKVGVGTLIQL